MKKGRKRLRKRTRREQPEIVDAKGAERMRAAGRLASEILDAVEEQIRPGISTGEIDRLVDEITRSRGAESAPYGYGGRHGSTPPFPGHCCTSVNDVVCHGIPRDEQVLAAGDIINVDVTPILDGYHGDSSRRFFVGEVSNAARRLVDDTWQAMWKGISVVRPGATVGDIGFAIQSFIEPRGHSVVREFTGHGIGTVFHTAPTVLHYGVAGEGDHLVPGMTFTIEPMVNVGHWKTEILEDGWTAVTLDGSLSAQFEHTCLVTEDGVEPLTLGKSETPPT